MSESTAFAIYLVLCLVAGMLTAVLVLGRKAPPRPAQGSPMSPSRWRGHPWAR